MKPREREAARERRGQGAVIKAIARELGVSTSSVSRWVRDIELSPAQRAALARRDPSVVGHPAGALARAAQARDRRRLAGRGPRARANRRRSAPERLPLVLGRGHEGAQHGDPHQRGPRPPARLPALPARLPRGPRRAHRLQRQLLPRQRADARADRGPLARARSSSRARRCGRAPSTAPPRRRGGAAARSCTGRAGSPSRRPPSSRASTARSRSTPASTGPNGSADGSTLRARPGAVSSMAEREAFNL